MEWSKKPTEEEITYDVLANGIHSELIYLTSAPRGYRTHRGGNVDKERVAIDAHGLQKGVASNLPLSPLPPGQETP